jgi:type IV pilus assembly protein PilB
MALSTEHYKDIFVTRNRLLSENDFNQVIQLAAKTRQPLEQLLMGRSFITVPQFLQLLEGSFGVPSIALSIDQVDTVVLLTIPEDYASKHLVIAFAKDEHTLSVALEDPSDQSVLQEIQSYVDLTIKPFIATKHALQQALILYKGNVHDRIEAAAAPFGPNSGAGSSINSSATTLLDAIIEAAILMDASDIHIEPYDTEIIIMCQKTAAFRPGLNGSLERTQALVSA